MSNQRSLEKKELRIRCTEKALKEDIEEAGSRKEESDDFEVGFFERRNYIFFMQYLYL